MKNFLLLFVLAAALPLHADDHIRDVQTALKTQGFYYGEIDGSYSTETTAALRRYQIRNGLEVTGTLTDETTKSLNLGSAAAPAPIPPTARPKPSTNESDRSFLKHEEAQQPPVARAPIESAPGPRNPAPASGELADFFVETPYANAPREVQESTLRRAQSQLASRGFYRQSGSSANASATEEALLTYQRATRLPLTGRLDLETLSALRLLPGRSPIPLKGFTPAQRTGERPVYRGVWVR